MGQLRLYSPGMNELFFADLSDEFAWLSDLYADGMTCPLWVKKQTFRSAIVMSALPPKTDMCGATRDVRYGPIADFRYRDAPFCETRATSSSVRERNRLSSGLVFDLL